MASVFSHVAVPVALTMAAGTKRISLRLLGLCTLLSAAPDLDSIGFLFDVPYGSQWGHRGFTHSLAFAVVVGAICAFFARRMRAARGAVFLFAFMSMASHGVLDAMTTGGHGVAFFWPFDHERYFCPWRKIEVSPISVKRFFSGRGLAVLESEINFIWIPCLIAGTVGWAARSLPRR